MKTPLIFVDQAGNVEIFDNLESAINEIEVEDVKRGEYKAFDADARALLIEISESKGLRSLTVAPQLNLVATDERHEDLLRACLSAFLARTSEDSELMYRSIEELIMLAKR